MKKIYLFLTLALLCCVDAVCAVYTPGELKTTVAAGDHVFIGAPYNSIGNRNDNLKWVSCRKGILTYTSSEAPATFDVVVLETATQTINGKAAFYLKSTRSGKYAKVQKFNITEKEDGTTITSTLVFTADVAEACPFAIVTATEGAEIMKYDGEVAVPEDVFMLLTNGPEEGDILALNQAFSKPTIATDNDWEEYGVYDGDIWYNIYSAEAGEDPIAELVELVQEVQRAIFYPDPTSSEFVTEIRSIIGGTNPGNRTDTAAVNTLYTLFAEIYEFVESGEAERDAEACAAKIPVLEAAYNAVLNSPIVPMREGYFRFINAGTSFLVRDKIMAMYATDNNAMWGYKDVNALNQVWDVKKNDDESWLVKNMDTQKYFLSGAQSQQVTMAEETSNYVVFEPLSEDAQFWLKLQQPDMPLHANGHQSGAGEGSNIVLWNAGANTASAWYVEEVTAEEIEHVIDVFKQDSLNEALAALLIEATKKYSTAAEFTPLLTSDDQISSNASQNEWGDYSDGDGYPALLDDDPYTYFHSCWQDGPEEPHYLQFALNEEITKPISFAWTRRVGQAYARNNCPRNVTMAIAPAGADLELAESWTTVAEITGMSLAVSADVPTYRSLDYELPFPAKYVRWTVTLTGPGTGQSNGQYFFSLGEFQLYSGLNPDCQLAQMGEMGTSFKAAINAAARVKQATQEDIDKLQAAIDVFAAGLAAPVELKNAIAKASAIAGGIIYGTNPGEYPENTPEEETLTVTLEQAKALIESGAYTQDSSAESVEALNAAYDAFMALVNPIETTKWYTLTFPSVYYEMKGLSKLDMSGKVVTLDGDAEDAVPGSTELHMVPFDEVENRDMALWRFVAIGDTAYAIQNKATGLYMDGTKAGYHTTLTLTPAMVKAAVKGYGCFLLDAFRLDGTHVNPIHCQTSGEVVIGWPSYDLGSNSMWEIHEVEDVTDEPKGFANINVRRGMPYMKCYPVSISGVEGASIYRIAGISEYHLCLVDIANEGDGVVPAGEPFILMAGTVSDYDRNVSEDDVTVTLRLGNEIEMTPQEANYLVGTYYGTVAEAGHMIFDMNSRGPVLRTLTAKRNIDVNSAYINLIGTQLGEAEEESTIIPTGKDSCSVDDEEGYVRRKAPMRTPLDGMVIAFNRIAKSATGEEADAWLCAKADDATIAGLVNGDEPYTEKACWVLEVSDEVIAEGYPSFYLKNKGTGQYLKLESTDGTSGIMVNLILGEKTGAQAFAIVPTAVGVPLLGSDKTDFGDNGGVVKDGDWMLISLNRGIYCAVNTVFTQAFVGTYSDYATWYTAYEIEYYEDVQKDLEEALAEIEDLYVEPGNTPGYCPQELFEKYSEELDVAVDNIYELLNQDDPISADDARAAIERLNNAYTSMCESRIPVTDGFYRFVSAYWAFEEYQGIRYAMCAEDNVLKWKAYDAEADDEVWYVKALGDNRFAIMNVSNTLYMVAPDVISLSAVVNKMGDAPVDDVTIDFFNKASSAQFRINGSPLLHTKNHQYGEGTGGNIVFWNAAYDTGSAWIIEPLAEDEALKYGNEMEQRIEQNRIAREFKELLAEATERYTTATGFERIGDGLITEVEQLSSNADYNALTGMIDGGGLAALIDGDTQTYFHSIWTGSDVAPDAYHNLTVDLKQAVDKFVFTMTARRQAVGVRNRPTEIVLYGSKDGADVSEADSWEQLTVLTGLPDSEENVSDAALNYVSPGCKLPGEYRYLRFEVTETNNGASISVGDKDYPFFSMAEFQVYKAQENDLIYDYGEAGIAFEEAYLKATAVEIPTQQDVDELRAALEDFLLPRTRVDLRITPVGFATLMLPYDAALPRDIKAYTVSQASEMNDAGIRVLTLEEVDALQAHTPYIIQGGTGSYRFVGLTEEHEDTYTSGWLTGTYVDRLAEAGTYVLQNNHGKTGFYRVAEGSEPLIKANRAWLTVPSEEGDVAEVTAFVFADDTATGIDGVDTAADRRVDVYTLDGVRVRANVRMSEALEALPRGVYVVNGTKKLVK